VSEVVAELVDVTVRRGATLALDRASLALDAGALALVLGANGAGKSTLLALLAGQLEVTSGRLALALPRHRRGYAAQRGSPWPDLTPAEQLVHLGRLHGLTAAAARARAETLLERAGLAAVRDRLAGTLSGGMQRRLAVTAALVARPGLLVLDEPTAHLDPGSREAVVRLAVDACAEGAAVVVATHEPDVFAPWTDRVAVLRAGRVERCGAPASLLSGRASTLRLGFGAVATALEAAERARALALEVTAEGGSVRVRGADLAPLLALASGVSPATAELAPPRLADLVEGG
jgi:ABC-2 type transport system ATP-binding protein